ncbi:unnamed protein product [Rhizoctonia solani]|uniref:DUF6535 domain-containing protein n=1 Tax=Rhizoctonia solani TaxID=456999 RepID=A0A8H3C5N6_9AGAM|nr:unnamed protein product [Rhizoctonia solani]
MEFLIPTNRSASATKGKRKEKGIDPQGNPLPSSSHQGFIKDIPDVENRNTESKEAQATQPIQYKIYQQDDPFMQEDEYGAELTRDARVWKVYVKEADRWDAELVDGWNKSLDVILVFAALFSAVSTTFLIESSGMLKQDPNDISAAALVVISQALVALANSSSLDLAALSGSEQNATSTYVPPHNAVVINTLWYLSLATSLATSFLAMLAKDWCHSFNANRAGHPWDQAQRRQRKWMMIEDWKMQELIVLLPSLIHLSLFFYFML